MTERRPDFVRSRVLIALLALVSAGVLAGCVSTKERFQKAQTLKAQGRYVEATYALVKVLEDDRSFPNARRELLDVAQTATDRLMTDAQRADDAGGHVEAANRLSDVAALNDAVNGVDVEMALPRGFRSFRDGVERRATEQLIAEADDAAAAGDWRRADDAYERARSFPTTPEQQRAIDQGQARVALNWADDEMETGDFRAAHARAARVYDLVGTEHRLARDARDLQDVAVERGTRRVAFTPLWRTETAADVMPSGFLRDLNDVLNTRHWTSPPPFIASADPVATRRALRRAGLHRRVVSRRDAAAVGRALGADYVVVGEVAEVTRVEDDLERTVVDATLLPDATGSDRGRGPTRGRRDDAGVDTSFVVESFDLEMHATVVYRVVDVRRARVVAEGDAHGGADGPMERGVFRGDWQNLDLTGAEQALFRRDDRQRAEMEIATRAVDAVAASLADTVYPRILDRID